MENKNLMALILALLILFFGVVSFFAGMKYQEKQQKNGFNLRIGDQIQIDTEKGQIKAPFVDIEYDKK